MCARFSARYLDKGIANPIAMIWAGMLMLEFLGEKDAAGLIIRAIGNVVEWRGSLTPDLDGVANTKVLGQAISQEIGKL